MVAGTEADRGYERRWWTLVVLCLSLLVISLDNTILNVALPTLVRDLSATSSQLQWIVDAYVLVFAGLLLTFGALGDRFGRRRALMAGYLVFAVGSVLAAWSETANQLIVMRALMGVGGALIMPATLSILTNVFPAHERPKAIAIWAGTAGVGVPIGPVAGGWLLEHFWWGSVFLINVPIVLVAVVATLVLVPESKDPLATPLDPVGALLSIAGLAAVLYAIIEAPVVGWRSGETLAWFASALFLLLLFVVWEQRVRYPMLDMRLFRKRSFTGASLAITLVAFALFGSMFFLTQYLQLVLGYTALQAGLRITPIAVGIILGAGISTRVSAHFGVRFAVTAGMAIAALGLAIMSRISMESGYGLVLTSLLIIGFGMGNAMAPATDSIMGAVDRDHAGVGSAVNDTTRQVGGALGVAVLGSLLVTAYSSAMERATHGLPPDAASAARDSVGAATQVAARIGGPEGAALLDAARRAFIDAMGQTVLIGVGFALVGALVAAVVLPSRSETTEAGHAKMSGTMAEPVERGV